MEDSGIAMPSPVILVVEDDPPIARLIRDTLEMEGFTALLASTGEEGVTVIADPSTVTIS